MRDELARLAKMANDLDDGVAKFAHTYPGVWMRLELTEARNTVRDTAVAFMRAQRTLEELVKEIENAG